MFLLICADTGLHATHTMRYVSDTPINSPINGILQITDKMEIKNIRVQDISPNTGQIEGLPKNPRFIRDERFDALRKSIEDAPEMLSLRELLVFPHKGKYVAIGGNMRLRACRDIGYAELPCKVLDPGTPVDKLREYAIKDNESFGQYDFGALVDEWDAVELGEWGAEIPDFDAKIPDFDAKDDEGKDEIEENEEDEQVKEKPVILDLLFPSDNDLEIPCLLKERMAGRIELPITPWGANSRLTKGVNTYHFYVDDYRFDALFKDPSKLVESGCKKIVEPNCSLHDQTPIAYGLQLIYKKRWLARYMQEIGVDVYVDLNVARKFSEYNLYGVPEGWDAFFTRGLAGQIDLLNIDLETARRVSGKETPNLVVYGGGKDAEKFCQKNGLLYVTDFINAKKD